ncbi:MAG: TonB-dependent receptor, partial [Bacteroidota bacterium]|nr:TonB-dependent receptor [Bacteroidota bacterium]
DKNLESTGQTATEVMKNIPSVNVDIDGNVTLRNATPIIFIDDRPTTLTLDQIPADIIEKIEVITNPSAKYDASGGNAGIINIILKKNKKVGYNGGVRAGTDSYGKLNGGGDFNLREGKINAFINANYNQRKFVSTGTTEQNNFFNPPSNANSTSDANNNGEFKFIRGGLDFLADNRNTFTVAGSYVRGHFNSVNNFNTDSLINAANVAYNQSSSYSDRNFENTGGQLGYKHNFAKSGHNLTADFNYNSSDNNSSSNNGTYTYYPNSTVQKQNPLLQQTFTQGYNKFYTIQSDYENPISDTKKFEAGVRAAVRDFGNNSTQTKYNAATGVYDVIPAISNNYKFNDQVYAAYVNYGFKLKKWNYQLGLRVESSSYTGTLLDNKGADSSTFSVKYPVSLFPSAFVTYKLTDKQDLQINYSRRVNRPNFFQLMPFPNYSNYPIMVTQGNPGLNPEFTNSLELSYNNAYKPNANFLATAYFKYTTNLITQYIYRGKDALNPNTSDSIYYSTFVNANSGVSYGLELTNKIPVVKWWELLLNVNLFSSKINASSINTNTGSSNISLATNSIVSWFGKINNTFKIAKGYSIQLSGYYQSKTVLPQNNTGGGGGPFNQVQTTAQGYLLARYDVDMAFRKDWTWKKGQSGSLTLSMNDIFRTGYQKSYAEQIGLFNQNTERLMNPQVLRLTFSYRFGKFDPNLFKRKNTKADQNNNVDMMN